MAGEQARRPLSVEEAKLQLLALDAQQQAQAAASAGAPLDWLKTHPVRAAQLGGAAAAGLLVARLLMRPKQKVVKVEQEGAAAAGAKGGVIAAAVALAARQLLSRYAAEYALRLVERYSPRGRQTPPSAPAGTPWGPGARR